MARKLRTPAITTRHRLLTRAWKDDVDVLETAIGRFASDAPPHANDCQVMFFEIAGDEDLHVNVKHKHQTVPVSGWLGPANMADGFVHNRTFGDVPPSRIIRHIHDMVFALRDFAADEPVEGHRDGRALFAR
jgi:hypothetical protein